jgi:pyridoxamine-phosphate oxidase
MFLGGVMEHIEEAGIHSGDSACSLPPISLTKDQIEQIRQSTFAIGTGVGVIGLLNVQYALSKNVLYVLEANPRAALTFWWGGLERQVNISGRISKTSAQESELYFASRPLASQLGAWASPQSSHLPERHALEQAFEAQKVRWEGQSVPRPEHWGGYLLAPETIEFWQGRRSRLHDRLRYSRDAEGRWQISRLAP